MRHRIAGRQLSRSSSHRRALRRNLAASLIEHGAIRTTAPKAKELRRFIEKLITTARRGTLHARRQVIALLRDRKIADDEADPRDWKGVVRKLFDEIAPRYADRPGGYTRIIRLAERRLGDAGDQVLVQLVEEGAAGGAGEAATTSRRRRRAAKRREAAEGAEPAAEQPAEADQKPAPDADAEGPAPAQ